MLMSVRLSSGAEAPALWFAVLMLDGPRAVLQQRRNFERPRREAHSRPVGYRPRTQRLRRHHLLPSLGHRHRWEQLLVSGVLRPDPSAATRLCSILFYGALSICCVPTSKLLADGRRLTDIILSRHVRPSSRVALHSILTVHSVFSALIVDRTGGSDAVC